jgi:hypothetical protein
MQNLLKKQHGKRPLEGLRCLWRNSINIGLKEVGHGGVGWIQLAQDRVRWLALVNAVMDSNCNNGEEFLDELRDYHLLTKV